MALRLEVLKVMLRPTIVVLVGCGVLVGVLVGGGGVSVGAGRLVGVLVGTLVGVDVIGGALVGVATVGEGLAGAFVA